ncbi:hypothetical protein HOD50_01630 [Candidatus Bathyarchaeota archaeon]|jgi:hypothetical protein|nr:hypothetical protein [Candidatus Bathyarchaeota archaeon]
MTSEIYIINDLDDLGKNKWNGFVEQVPDYTIYNTYGWVKALQEGEQLQGRHVIVEKDGVIIGALPCFISSIRGTPFKRLDSNRPGSGGPLLLHDKEKTLNKISRKIKSLLRGTIISHRILSINHSHLSLNKLLSEQRYYLTINNVDTVYNLTGTWKQVLGRMSKNRRREIKNADSGKVTELSIEPDNINRFNISYAKVLSRHGARPLQPGFIQEIAHQFPDKAKLFTVEENEVTIGGYLVIIDEPNNMIRAVAGGIPDIHQYSKHSNNLFRKLLEYTKEHGFSYLDVGGSPADISNGLYRFKKSFGGTDYPIYCWQTGNLVWDMLRFVSKIKPN